MDNIIFKYENGIKKFKWFWFEKICAYIVIFLLFVISNLPKGDEFLRHYLTKRIGRIT